MNRWVHALLALLALSILVALVTLWSRPEPDPAPPAPSPSDLPTDLPTDLPPPSGPVPTSPAPLPPSPTPTCPEAAPTRLRVATFNIHGGARRDGTYDLVGVAEEIRAWEADVVLLQEVYRYRASLGLDDQPARLARLLGMHIAFGRNVLEPAEAPGAPRREYGTAILSRHPIASSTNRPLPNLPGLQQRGLLGATLALPGRRIEVFNTHLQHTRGNIRILQNRAVRRLVAATPHAFLLGGDFNAEPGSPAMDVLRGLVRDPWPRVGAGEGLTVPPNVPKRRIDYVLHGAGGWIPEQAQVVRSSIADHRAVLVDFALPAVAC